MFCTKCGHEVAEGSAFCTECGAPIKQEASSQASEPAAVPAEPPVPVASQPAPEQPQPAPGPAAAASQPAPAPAVAASQPEQPKCKRWSLIVAGIVAVLAVIALALAILLPSGSTTVSGIDGAQPASVVTRIRPQDASGTFLTSYRVRLYALSAVNDKLGEELAREARNSDPVREVRVTGDGGFTFGDMDNVPDGDYLVVIIDNDTDIEQEVIVQYEEENNKAEQEIIVTPPAEDGAQDEQPEEQADPRAASYALYLAKCQEIIGTYGEGTALDVMQGTSRAATGLVLAQTIDFNGDGLEELLVVYTTSNLAESFQMTEDTYRIEVWAYNPEGNTAGEDASASDGAQDAQGSIELIHEQQASYTNGGATFLTQYVCDNKVYLFFDGVADIDYAAEGLPESTVRYVEGLWGMQDDQTFAKVLETWNQYDYNEPGSAFDRYFLNGTESTPDAYDAETALYHNASTYNFIEFTQFADSGVNSLGSSGQSEVRYSVDQTLQITRDTLTLLEAGATAEADAVAANEGA